MKHRYVWVLPALFFISLLSAQRNCATMDVLDRQVKENPSILKNMEEIEFKTQEFIRKFPNGTGSRAVITIPVVVHVVWNSSVPAQNISDAQIQSQIDVLNADFTASNSDISYVPSYFQSAIGNVEVQFCLASRDPSGSATTGVTRKSSSVVSWGTNDNVKKNSAGGIDPWNPAQYLNLWVCNIGGGILGYAQLPGGATSTDGVVCDYRYFGTIGTATAPYAKGRTATHEVGHWLNLRHIWGDANCGNDLVADTPTQQGPNYNACFFNGPLVTCNNGPNGDMYMNYMDYAQDACMQMFTTGQKSRMRAVLEGAGARASLANSPGCMAPNTSTCNAPLGLTTSGVTQTTVNADWGGATNATSYTVQYKLNSSSNWISVNSLFTFVTLNGLTAGTAYNIRVVTNCASGSSQPSGTINFTTSPAAPPCAGDPESNNTAKTAKVVTPGTPLFGKISVSSDVDWFKFSNLSTKKNIRVSLTNQPADFNIKLYKGTTLQVGVSENLGLADEWITRNAPSSEKATTFYVQVYGTGSSSSNDCYTLLVETNGSTYRLIEGEIEGDFQAVIDEFLIFPNPATDEIAVLLPFGDQTEGILTINDITGKSLMSQKVSSDQGAMTVNVNTTELSSGFYIASFRTGDLVYSQKLIITERK